MQPNTGESPIQASLKSEEVPDVPDVPGLVFEKFLQALEENHVSSELIAKLRKVLLEQKTFTERALKDALFGQE